MGHPLDTVAPRPTAATATARDTAGWYAANALFHFGRAETRRRLHGGTDTTYLHLLDTAGQETNVAYLLWAAAENYSGDTAARELLSADETLAADEGQLARSIAKWAGLDPDAAHRLGTES